MCLIDKAGSVRPYLAETPHGSVLRSWHGVVAAIGGKCPARDRRSFGGDRHVPNPRREENNCSDCPVLRRVVAAVFLTLSQTARISFASGNEEPFIIKSDNWVYMRVYVKNSSFKEAKCQLFLTNLSKEGGESIIRGERLRLNISNIPFPEGFDFQTIGPQFPALFDLAYITSDEKAHLQIPAFPRPPGNQFTAVHPEPLLAGFYKFTVQTDGENCTSEPETIGIKFNGWPDITVVSNQH